MAETVSSPPRPARERGSCLRAGCRTRTRRHTAKFPEAVRLGIQGFHFEGIMREALACNAIRQDSSRVVDRIRKRYVEATERASDGVANLSEETRSLYRMRRDALKRARRRVRRLPKEYRLFGKLELQALRQRLDDLLPERATAPAPA